MFKLPYNCSHFTCQQGNPQNTSSQALVVPELRTSRCTSQIQKRQKNQKSNCQHLLDHRNAREIQKNFYFCFTDYAKAFDCVDHNKLWKILKEMEIPPYLPPAKPMCRSTSKLELDMKQHTGSKLGKEYIKAVYHHPACLTSRQSISCEMLVWMKHNWSQIVGRNINNLRYADDTTLNAKSKEELKNLLMKVKERVQKLA